MSCCGRDNPACCRPPSREEVPPPNAPRDEAPAKTGAALSLGSVAAAILSSACCWLPLLLLAFGASAAGAGALLHKWRPVLAVAAVVMLTLGYWSAYVRPRCRCADGGAPRARRAPLATRATLWISAVIVAAFVLFPSYVGALIDSARAPAGTSAPDARDPLTFAVTGMHCDACAVTLRATIETIEGVESARVEYRAGAPGRLEVLGAGPAVTEKVRGAAASLGYEATQTGGDLIQTGSAN